MLFAEFALSVDALQQSQSQFQELVKLFSCLETAELPHFVYLLQGRIQEPFRERKPANPPVSLEMLKAFIRSNRQAANLATGAQATPLTITAAYEAFHTHLKVFDGQFGPQHAHSSGLLQFLLRLSEPELALASRILTGSIVKDDLLLQAIARLSRGGEGIDYLIKAAYRVTLPDLGLIASIAIQNYTAMWNLKLRVGTPVKPQEITLFQTVEKAWQGIKGIHYVQPKLNGVQIQIHKEGDSVHLFDRTLVERTEGFRDVVEDCRKHLLFEKGILDCEIVGIDAKGGQVLSGEMAWIYAHHRAYVFDLLSLEDEDWRDVNYEDRRRKLAAILPSAGIVQLIYERTVQSVEDLEQVFKKAMQNTDMEGLIILQADGKYTPNAINKTKGKLKPYLSLDCIVTGYTLQDQTLSLFLGVWDQTRAKIIPVGDVTGGEIPKEIRAAFLKTCAEKQIPPSTKADRLKIVEGGLVSLGWVVEIFAEGRTRSSTYGPTGYALYRQKGIRIREDLSLEDADTLDQFLALPLPPQHRRLQKTIAAILGYKLSPGGVPSFMAGIWDEGKNRLIAVGGIEGETLDASFAGELLELCKQRASAQRPGLVSGSVTPKNWVRPEIIVELRTDGSKVKSVKYRDAGYTFHHILGVVLQKELSLQKIDDLNVFQQCPTLMI